MLRGEGPLEQTTPNAKLKPKRAFSARESKTRCDRMGACVNVRSHAVLAARRPISRGAASLARRAGIEQRARERVGSLRAVHRRRQRAAIDAPGDRPLGIGDQPAEAPIEPASTDAAEARAVERDLPACALRDLPHVGDEEGRAELKNGGTGDLTSGGVLSTHGQNSGRERGEAESERERVPAAAL